MKGSIRNLKSKMKSQAGFSLIEIVLVLTIVGALTILTLSSFNDSSDTSDAQEELKNVSALSSSVKHMFKTQGTYVGLENSIILNDVSFPEQMRGAGTDNIKSVWQDDGYEVAEDNTEFAGSHFTITMKNVPKDACTNIASSSYRHFVSVTVGSTAINGVASASGACTDNATIIFLNR